MIFDSIHETVVSDILDSIKNGVKTVDKITNSKAPKISSASSLANATSGLTLVFPVICSDSLPIDTAVLVSKAIERKNISLLQMAFSAYNITNDTDAITHLSHFHQNLDTKSVDVAKFIDIMDTYNESSILYKSTISAIEEDCKRNINYTLDDSINESSLLEFSEVTKYGNMQIVKEALPYPSDSIDDDSLVRDAISKNGNRAKYASDVLKSEDEDRRAEENRKAQDKRLGRQIASQKAADAKRNKLQARDLDQKLDANLGQAADQKRQYFATQLLSSDVKKANEMQPSLMLVNFYINDKDRDLNIAQQIVAGVKSKLYAVSSADIINKIISKHVDGDILLKLVKVSTREISFVKDFLLGLDDAKLNALTKSKRGSGSTLFNALERRAIKGKIRKALRLENSAKAISTLVVSMEEAEEIRKNEYIDIMEPKTIIPIMEKLNLLYFIVVDTVAETIYMLTDGSTDYEVLSFTSLEKDAGDSTYKKVINLMTRVSR